MQGHVFIPVLQGVRNLVRSNGYCRHRPPIVVFLAEAYRLLIRMIVIAVFGYFDTDMLQSGFV